MEKLGGRKLVATLACLLVGGVTVALKGDVPANFLMLLQTALGAFVGGNVVEHWSRMKSGVKISPAAPVNLEPVETKITALEEKLDSLTQLTVAAAGATKSTNELLIDLAQKRG